MTVRELIEKLEQIEDKDLTVIVDSDNCYDGVGECSYVQTQEWKDKDNKSVFYVALIGE